MLECKDEDTVLLDVRNKNEWEIVHFKNSVEPEFRTFSEFLNYAENVSETLDKEKKIMMYCTGGIRNELYKFVDPSILMIFFFIIMIFTVLK